MVDVLLKTIVSIMTVLYITSFIEFKGPEVGFTKR